MSEKLQEEENGTYMPIRLNRENLRETKSVVGRGQFAISFMLGSINLQSEPLLLRRHHQNPKKSPPVLIKHVTKEDHKRCFDALRREINILESLKPYRYILNLVAACTSEMKNKEIYLAFEFCGNGNLLKFIRHCNPSSEFEFDSVRSMVTHTETGPVLTLTRHRLVQWCYEIASGMEYLATNNICHNDLAARNILVTNQWNTKICNFGLSEKKSSQATNSASPPLKFSLDVLPLKWMSPESLRHGRYSEKSDVWSFSITMWEICSLGEIPYRKWNVEEDFWKVLARGERLAKPRFATAEMWTLICSCWEYWDHNRPTFSQISEALNLQMESRETASRDKEGGNVNRKIGINQLTSSHI